MALPNTPLTQPRFSHRLLFSPVNMDRTAKFSADEIAAIKAANVALTTTQAQA